MVYHGGAAVNHLTYDHTTHRRCIGCEAEGGQYPLRRMVDTLPAYLNRAVLLECGHLDSNAEEFVQRHTRSEHW